MHIVTGEIGDVTFFRHLFSPAESRQVREGMAKKGGVPNFLVRDIAFQGSGCAISTASASMMTEALKGKTETEARAIFERFHELITGNGAPDSAGLGKLAAFSGVRDYPVRVKCAVLCWHTLKAALDERKETVATE